MNAITLRVKNAPGFRVDGSKLLPVELAVASRTELPRIVLQGAGETCEVGDLFDIALIEDEEPSLAIEGDAHWLDRIGANMTEGTLAVHAQRRRLRGHKDDRRRVAHTRRRRRFAACEMQGGRLTIHGDAAISRRARCPATWKA